MKIIVIIIIIITTTTIIIIIINRVIWLGNYSVLASINM